ncbi:DUF935 domain-containing protein [Megalodesulfovibrio paquesii]
MLYDHLGRPVRPAELTREVAAPRLTGLRNPWPDALIASRLTPDRVARILMDAGQGDCREFLGLAEEMEERDLHYAGVLGTRKLAVAGLARMVEAASDAPRDQELADAVRALVATPQMTWLVMDLLDALGKGFAAVEICWERGPRWTPREYKRRDPRWFIFDRDSGEELRLLDPEYPDGMPLPPYQFVVHYARLKSGLPIRGGLARLCLASFLCKSWTVTDWMRFAELFGMPLRVGRYGPSASADDIGTLVSAVANLGTDAACVLPDSMRIEFQQAGAVAGGQELFLKLAEYLDKQVSKGVLGQTMTTDDGASMAQAKIHNEVRLDILAYDALNVEATLNRDLIEPYIQLNWGKQAVYPRLTLPVPEPEDTAGLVDALAKLVPLGLRVEASVVRDKLGLPDPEEDGEVLGEKKEEERREQEEEVGGTEFPRTPSTWAGDDSPGESSPAQAGGPGGIIPPGSRAAQSQGAGSVGSAAGVVADSRSLALLEDIEAEMLADEWEPVAAELTDPVVALAEACDSFEEFAARLPELLETLAPTQLAASLARAAFTARGAGDATD